MLLDGQPVNEVRLEDLRRSVSIVFEDTVVFTASIRENLRIGEPDASDRDIEHAAALSEADEFIRALPHGYDTVVGPQGYSLSGGQRQRLAIARAILRDSRLLILDDAMSAVDPPTEAAIRRGLLEAMKGRTTLVIAHRIETISLADRVVLLDAGRIVADGSHEELLKIPAYRHALALDERPREGRATATRARSSHEHRRRRAYPLRRLVADFRPFARPGCIALVGVVVGVVCQVAMPLVVSVAINDGVHRQVDRHDRVVHRGGARARGGRGGRLVRRAAMDGTVR